MVELVFNSRGLALLLLLPPPPHRCSVRVIDILGHLRTSLISHHHDYLLLSLLTHADVSLLSLPLLLSLFQVLHRPSFPVQSLLLLHLVSLVLPTCHLRHNFDSGRRLVKVIALISLLGSLLLPLPLLPSLLALPLVLLLLLLN